MKEEKIKDMPYTVYVYQGRSYRTYRTCYACPEQYDVYLDGSQVGYIRLRHGQFECNLDDYDGEVLIDKKVSSDGIFDCEEEREKEILASVVAIHEKIKKQENKKISNVNNGTLSFFSLKDSSEECLALRIRENKFSVNALRAYAGSCKDEDHELSDFLFLNAKLIEDKIKEKEKQERKEKDGKIQKMIDRSHEHKKNTDKEKLIKDLESCLGLIREMVQDSDK